MPDDVEVLTLSSGVGVRLFRPAGARVAGPALLWIHGGGYVIGDAAQDDVLCRRFARELGVDRRVGGLPAGARAPVPRPARGLLLGAEVAGGAAVGGSGAGGDRRCQRRWRPCRCASRCWPATAARSPLAAQLLVYPMIDDRTVRPRRARQSRASAVEPVEQPVRLVGLPRRRRPRRRGACAPRRPRWAAAGVDRCRHAGPVSRRGPRLRRAAAGRGRAVRGRGGRRARSTDSTGSCRKPKCRNRSSTASARCCGGARARRGLRLRRRSKTTSPAMTVAATMLGVEFAQHVCGPVRRQHAQVARLAGLDARGAQRVGRAGRRTSSTPRAPRHIRPRRVPRRWRWCAVHRGAHRRPRILVAERHVRGQRDRHPGLAAARPPATARGVRRRGRRRGTGPRARRRSWAGSPRSLRSSARSATLSSGTTAACSMRSCGWRPPIAAPTA